MMKKNVIQVVIGGKVLSMCGTEDELHIQKVAACVNKKLSELEPTEGYRTLPTDLKPVLIQLNLADDLISAQETIDMLKSDIHAMENELSEVKQKLVETQMELEELESSAVQMTLPDDGWKPGRVRPKDAPDDMSGNAGSRSAERATQKTSFPNDRKSKKR